MNLVITGGAGFIGSHFLELALTRQEINHVPFESIIVIDKLTYASSTESMKLIENLQTSEKLRFYKVDITDYDKMSKIIKKSDYVVNFAAESHVDNSIHDSTKFVATNVLGASTLLEIAKKVEVKRFLQISTDEVYGSIEFELWNEDSLIDPSSPYSASKASADLIALSFFKTHNLPILITRSSNNFGPRQNIEKMIPKIIDCLKNDKQIPLYGNGTNIREWIFVKENVEAIWCILENGKPGHVYNIGSGSRFSNLELISKIAKFMNVLPKIRFVQDRKAHDYRYALSAEKLYKDLQFKPSMDFDHCLQLTIDSYINR